MATATTQVELSSRIHFQLIRGLVETGYCPTNAELAGELGQSIRAVEEALSELARIHGVVLHPHVCEPWVIHPFSMTPTMHWIRTKKGELVGSLHLVRTRDGDSRNWRRGNSQSLRS